DRFWDTWRLVKAVSRTSTRPVVFAATKNAARSSSKRSRGLGDHHVHSADPAGAVFPPSGAAVGRGCVERAGTPCASGRCVVGGSAALVIAALRVSSGTLDATGGGGVMTDGVGGLEIATGASLDSHRAPATMTR